MKYFGLVWLCETGSCRVAQGSFEFAVYLGFAKSPELIFKLLTCTLEFGMFHHTYLALLISLLITRL